jgi:hypothetical protein
MDSKSIAGPLALGILVCIGMIALGYFVSDGIVTVKALDRTVTVKGLSERDVPASVAIWPIKFNEVSNDLTEVYAAIQRKNSLIVSFLKGKGFEDGEIATSVPSIVDRQAQDYGDASREKFRYSGSSIITVYTADVSLARGTMNDLVELGKSGIAISGQDYQTRTEFLFTGLNEIKPMMIEEATRNAREVAEKFAKDSGSELGKIKKASQGQFSIEDRDSNTPHMKKVRVVSTVEYYLSD